MDKSTEQYDLIGLIISGAAETPRALKHSKLCYEGLVRVPTGKLKQGDFGCLVFASSWSLSCLSIL